MESDIDTRVENFGFTPSTKILHYVQRAREYFEARRSFYEQNKEMISDDYRHGVGAKAFWLKGLRHFSAGVLKPWPISGTPC